MEINELLTPRSVVAQLRVTGKKQALQEIARRAATMTGVNERRIYEVLSERERLGANGIGRGDSVPAAQVGRVNRGALRVPRADPPGPPAGAGLRTGRRPPPGG